MLTGIKNTSEIFRRNNCGNSTESEEDKEKARKLVFEISPDKRRKLAVHEISRERNKSLE